MYGGKDEGVDQLEKGRERRYNERIEGQHFLVKSEEE